MIGLGRNNQAHGSVWVALRSLRRQTRAKSMALRRQTFQQQSDTTIDSLLASLTPKDELAVRRFLSDHGDLLPYVETAKQLVRKVFRDDASGIVLKVTDHAEHEGSFLTVGIETALSARDAIDRLHAFDDEWLAVVDGEIGEQILVTLVRT